MKELIKVSNENKGRRQFLKVVIPGTILGISGFTSSRLEGIDKTHAESGKEEEEISPAEDLMREHGVLKRILLVYGEAQRRLEANENLPLQAVLDSAGIIRSFIEDYHEKLEEDFLFPRFKKANRFTDLVDVLVEQHQAGRRVTEKIVQLAGSKAITDPQKRRYLAKLLGLFIRMYSPHEAREDTVLFPAIRDVVSPKEYGDLGEKFEEKEHKLFGEHGFEAIVERVAKIEKSLGLFDLAQFTPG
jgi:hemerythrin-like domain-containing protein